MLTCWDWAALGNAKVVDVGSSVGLAGMAIVGAFSAINVISQDNSDDSLERGAAMAATAGLSERIQLMHHDFFLAQPVSAKAYIFKSLLHGWPDADCVRIIQALLPALRQGAHVLVGESFMPDPPAVRGSAWDDRAIRVEEQLMIAGHGASERTLAQFQAIFTDASERLHYVGTTRGSNGGFFSLIDYVFRE